MAWGESWDKIIKPMQEAKKELIIGVDLASGPDYTVIHDGNGNIIGESVELTISTGPWKSKTIQAIQIGDLAVYFGEEDDIGLIIHVPTLTKFDRAISDGEWTQDQLIQWCWKVQQISTQQWKYLKTFNNTNYREIDFTERNVLMNNCLSIIPGD